MILVSRAPWPVGVVLAMLSYMVLNPIAQEIPLQTTSTSDISRTLFSNLGITIAEIGRYVLPLLFLFAALGSYLRRRRDGQIYGSAAATPKQSIANLSWREFEHLIGEVFRRRGFTATTLAAGGPDGGVDVRLRRDGELHLVQCKHWRARKVPVATVRELYGVMAAQGAAGGFVVTSGEFTSEAIAFAKGRNIELIDGRLLQQILEGRDYAEDSKSECEEPNSRINATPTCPNCGSEMIRRKARRGPNTGKLFWGCSSFPACRGTRPDAD